MLFWFLPTKASGLCSPSNKKWIKFIPLSIAGNHYHDPKLFLFFPTHLFGSEAMIRQSTEDTPWLKWELRSRTLLTRGRMMSHQYCTNHVEQILQGSADIEHALLPQLWDPQMLPLHDDDARVSCMQYKSAEPNLLPIIFHFQEHQIPPQIISVSPLALVLLHFCLGFFPCGKTIWPMLSPHLV